MSAVEWISGYLQLVWHLSASMGLYVLLGLFVVGIMHLYISDTLIKKHLGGRGWRPVLKGAVYGIPLPLCSCGVIPLATSLHRSGASKGSVTSFFITTPMTGVDSMIATYGVFGLPMALLRVFSSLISGILAGLAVEKEEKPTTPSEIFSQTQESSSCCSRTGCCDPSSPSPSAPWKKATDYALFEVFSDMAKPMLLGLLAAALLSFFTPKSLGHTFQESLWLSYIGVLLISIPVYICSTSAIPIALGLLSIGFSPGAAFIFLAAAPATNVMTAGIIYQILGKNVLAIYLTTITIITVLTGVAIDFLMPSGWFPQGEILKAESHSWLLQFFGGLFLTLLVVFNIPALKKLMSRET